MKTDDLIKALAADADNVSPPIRRTMLVAVVAGAALATLAFVSILGVRSDFALSMTTSIRFVFKFVVMLGVAVPAYLLIRNMVRPDFAPGQRIWWLAFPLALLAVGIVLELITMPSDSWHARMMGHNSFYCMTIVPLLALAPFAAVLYALKSGAPANPTFAGAVGGLLSAAIGATLYASHCPDDSPLFVATWYPVGFAVMGILGAVIGGRLLKW